MEVKVPDIGDFNDVPVIEVLVEAGQAIEKEAPLVTLESDKATMEIPSPAAGVVDEVLVATGDRVSEGTPLLRLTESGGGGGEEAGGATGGEAEPGAPASAAPAPAGAGAHGHGDSPGPAPGGPAAREGAPPAPDTSAAPEGARQLVVLGGGPGGYTAAFRAADLGLSVTLIERHERLGGVCLNVGCIPSKALLHVARVIAEAQDVAAHGVAFGDPEIDLDAVRAFKDDVVTKLTGGLDGLAKRRKVDVVRGEATFTGPHTLEVGGEEIAFEQCIVAAGSQAVALPFVPDDPRVVDSTGALALDEVPERLLVIGGGIIGLEMATVYDALGSQVTVVELLDQLIPGADADLVKPLAKRIGERYEAIHLGAKVTGVEARDDGLHVEFEGAEPAMFDRVLVAVGRRPNGASLGLDRAGVNVDEHGFVPVDDRLRTNVAHISAIGDIVGEPMLAHKATHEAKVAAEVIAGHDARFDVRSIPSVAYTDPEVAWTGLTETQAKADGTAYEVHAIPWAASGRALGLGRPEGRTKLLVDPESRRILGGGAVGVNAGELIAEIAHALEMGAVAEDVAATVHPHPTLSETIAFAAEMADGTITDLMPPRKRG
jgi:dihydrolipoamide dehydrogenase